ncbi:homoserine dehydrogenase [Peptostreptococcaceae bacterium AGR-M142]
MNDVNIGFLGFGVVNSGVYDILTKNKQRILKATNKNIIPKKALIRDIYKKRNSTNMIFSSNPLDIVDDPTIHIVIEAMGGIELPRRCILKALNNKKHVITVNKAVVSKHLDEFLKVAKENNVMFLFEGSVAGGTKIIKPLIEECRFDSITEIKGILNGTTNYILSKMYNENISYDDCLKEAQKLGFAEADPTDDVKGIDVKRKINILSSISKGVFINEDLIEARGIDDINLLDIKAFKKLNLIPKLIGYFRDLDVLNIGVSPMLVDNSHVFSNINNSFNIVSLKGDTKDSLFSSLGAGSLPTGSAILNDLMDVLNEKNFDIDIENKELDISSKLDGDYYLRLKKNREISKDYEYEVIDDSDNKYNCYKIFDTNNEFLKNFCLEDEFYCHILKGAV